MKLEASNLASVKEVKELFCQACNQRDKYPAKITPDNIRVFCLGKELKNELFLYSYGITESTTISAMVRLPEKPAGKVEAAKDESNEDGSSDSGSL